MIPTQYKLYLALLTIAIHIHANNDWTTYLPYVGGATVSAFTGYIGYRWGKSSEYADALARLQRKPHEHYQYHPCIKELPQPENENINSDNAFRIYRCLMRNNSNIDDLQYRLQQYRADFEYDQARTQSIASNTHDSHKDRILARARQTNASLCASQKLLYNNAHALRGYTHLRNSPFCKDEQNLRHMFSTASPQEQEQQLSSYLKKQYDNSRLYLAEAYNDIQQELQKASNHFHDVQNDTTEFGQRIANALHTRIITLRNMLDTLYQSEACNAQLSLMRDYPSYARKNRTTQNDPQQQEELKRKIEAAAQEHHKAKLWFSAQTLLQGINTLLKSYLIHNQEQLKKQKTTKQTSSKQQQKQQPANTSNENTSASSNPFESASAPPEETV